ncbi:MAG: tetratricopeptide repeat protein, partial [Nitrospirota bacterium]
MGRFTYNFKITGIILLSALIFIATSYASRESDLFDQAYGYYLSYQPEKAVETFRTFLKEFPQSSAGDAAMFWLGMSLIQLRAFDEAKKVFLELKEQFPESLYIPYVDRELEMIERPDMRSKMESGSLEIYGWLKKAEKRAELVEKKQPAEMAQEREIESKVKAKFEEPED